VILIITGATGTISKPLKKHLSNLPGKQNHEVQKTAILVIAQILPQVLT